MNLFFVVQYAYARFNRHDCLSGNDIHSITSDGSSDHNNCKEWCNNNVNCGGFGIYSTTCFFKSHACRSDLGGVHYGTTIFLKLGM